MKPHPWSEDAEEMMKILYRRTMNAEMKAYRCILGDLFASGYTESQLIDAYDDFMAGDPPTHSIRYFRAYMERLYRPSEERVRESGW